MNIVRILFSPTGGTKRVADILADNLGESAGTIDLSSAAEDFSAGQLDAGDPRL